MKAGKDGGRKEGRKENITWIECMQYIWSFYKFFICITFANSILELQESIIALLCMCNFLHTPVITNIERILYSFHHFSLFSCSCHRFHQIKDLLPLGFASLLALLQLSLQDAFQYLSFSSCSSSYGHLFTYAILCFGLLKWTWYKHRLKYPSNFLINNSLEWNQQWDAQFQSSSWLCFSHTTF